MRKLAILLLLLVSAAANGAITGTITDAGGKPIAGATIRAFAAEGSAAMRARLVAGKLEREPVVVTKSAENGSFSLDVKASPLADIAIDAPSYSGLTIATVDGDDLGSVVLNKPSTRMVRVTSGGKPVANAIVINGTDVWRTNSAGEVPSNIGGAYLVFHPDYAVTRRDATAGITEIKLTRGVALRGRIVKGSDPVAHAIVSINGWPLAESADDGTFTIAHAPDNWQSVSAMRGNEEGTSSRSKGPVEIHLSAGMTFTGSLRDTKRGAAVAGARMTLTGGDDLSMVTLSDAKGNFSFAPLQSRGYQIGGMHPGYSIDATSVTLPVTRSRTLAAQAFARANGRVIDEEKKPVAAAIVTTATTNSARTRRQLTNAAGEYSIRITPASFPLPIYASKREYVSGVSSSRIWQPGDVRNDVVITLVKGFVAQVKVVDKQQQPVPGAMVNVTRSGNDTADRSLPVACADPARPDCHRTGADGIVSLQAAEGHYDVVVAGDDMAPARLPNQTLSARSSTLVVHVDRGIEISGRVVLADGTPVADAIVEVPTGMMTRSATSGADGTFRITGIASGSSVVRAFSSDRRMSSPGVTVDAPAKDVTLTMPRGARVEGRVVDRATQQPVTDFTILLPSRNNNPGAMGGSSFSGGTPIHSDDGRYSLDNIPAGTLQLMVRATGYVPGTRNDITVEEGKTVSGIDLQLDKGATVSGRVTSASSPVAGVQVRLGFQRTPSFTNSTTDADGLYTLDGVPDGDQNVEFQKTGFALLRKPVSVASGKDVRLDVEMDPGRELRGRVVDHAGRGVLGAYVSADMSNVGGAQRPEFVTTDGDGSFSMQGLTDGRYRVTARKEGFVTAEANDVELPQMRPITLTLEAGATINGRVTGIPPEQFTQVIVTASGGSSRNQAYADNGGNFVLNGLPDGRVRVDGILTAGAGRRMAATKTIVIENGVAPLVELNFDEGITVSGHVTRSGSPLQAGSLAFMPRTQSRGPSDRQMSNASILPDGSYTATGLTAGDYDIRVNAPGINFSTKYTAVASGTFDIDIRGALLRGHVVDAANGAPLANARINVSARAPAFGSATSDSDGRFTIDALVDATYDLQANRDQYATTKQQIIVANGSVPDVELRMEQAPAVTIRITDAASGSAIDGNVMITDSTRSFNGQATRIDTGVFKVWLKPGSYTAGASARGYIFKNVPFTTPPAEVNVALVQGGSLIIRARTAQMVRLDLPAGGTYRLLGPIREGVSNPYESLQPGSYLLATIGSDRTVIRSLPVTIVAGQTITIDLP